MKLSSPYPLNTFSKSKLTKSCIENWTYSAVSILNRTFRASLAAVLPGLFCMPLFAAALSGTVMNRTSGKPSKGDTVALINTAQGMDELAKVTTDAQGKFQVNAPDGGQILLHITHAGAEYFKSVPPGSSNVDIDVYDSAAKIAGITGEALVLRAETDATGRTLNVTENFFIQNASTPPKTQYGGNTFEFFVPAGAKLTDTVASAPSGLPTNVEVKTLDAASGHYAFTFPVRPGENRFQIGYSLPYSGKQDFTIRLTIPTSDVAVMLPKSMQFQGQGSTQFQAISPDVNAQTFDAHLPPFSQPLQFTLSGAGQLPQAQEQAQGGAQQGGAAQQGAQQQASSDRPGGGLGVPVDPNDENDPWSKYKWWVFGILGLTLAAGAGLMLKRSALPAGAMPPHSADESYAAAGPEDALGGSVSRSAPPTTSTLQALKDELFELEADRLAGRITAAEYVEHKAAFDVMLRRALGRIEAVPAASNDQEG